MNAAALLLALAGASQNVQPIESQTPPVYAVRTTTPIVVDGLLSEEVWATAPAVTTFTQRDPTEGAAPSEKTEVRIAYDDEAIYVGARLLDSQPRTIVGRLGRRDSNLGADELTFYVDPYHDGRSGYYFAVNAAGTLRDGVLYNDDWNDDSWDGIWEGRAHVDGEGWTVEMRIPYSQLRFRREDSNAWGVNFRRYVCRTKEEDYVAYTPKNASGFVSRFPKLSGLQGIVPPRRIAVTPYTTTKAEFTGHDAGDPFNDGSRVRPAVGADFKVGLGSNLTIDATINPDFGQVEVDPAVVNLSDVETFFPEKRPFFVEGANNFRFGQGGATNWWGFNWGGPDLFYSRRIGRAPEGSLPDADFSDSPAGTRIVMASKLTGRLGHGWSLGALHAVTASETADLAQGGRRFRAQVEPTSQYVVARALRESPDNRRGLGVMATGVVRSLGDGRLRDELNAHAFTLGLDGWAFLGANKTWVVTGWAAATDVAGTAARIADLQQDAQHYFQRPDATHVRLDPTRTSLRGFAGRATVNKEKGNFLLNAAVGAIDPGFDVSDVGFQWRTDVINSHLWTGYRWTKAGRLTREADVGLAYFRSYDFGGNVTWQGLFAHERAALVRLRGLQPGHPEQHAHARRTPVPQPARHRVGQQHPLRRPAKGLRAFRAARIGLRGAQRERPLAVRGSDRPAALEHPRELRAGDELDPQRRAVPEHVRRSAGHCDLRPSLRVRAPRPDDVRGRPSAELDVHTAAEPRAVRAAAALFRRLRGAGGAVRPAHLFLPDVWCGRVDLRRRHRRRRSRRPRTGAGLQHRDPRLQLQIPSRQSRSEVGVPAGVHGVRRVDAEPLRPAGRRRRVRVPPLGIAPLRRPRGQHLPGEGRIYLEPLTARDL